VIKAARYLSVYRHANRVLQETLADPGRWAYTDVSITPPQAEEFDHLDLYHLTSGSGAALARKRREDALRAKAV
jgi:hypothetical protein